MSAAARLAGVNPDRPGGSPPRWAAGGSPPYRPGPPRLLQVSRPRAGRVDRCGRQESTPPSGGADGGSEPVWAQRGAVSRPRGRSGGPGPRARYMHRVGAQVRRMGRRWVADSRGGAGQAAAQMGGTRSARKRPTRHRPLHPSRALSCFGGSEQVWSARPAASVVRASGAARARVRGGVDK